MSFAVIFGNPVSCLESPQLELYTGDHGVLFWGVGKGSTALGGRTSQGLLSLLGLDHFSGRHQVETVFGQSQKES